MTEIKEDIKYVIDENKARAYEEQKEMRDDVAFFVLNCSVFNLQRMFSRMKELKNEENNS
jgi:hypothetical protein|tara:strand:- start:246 stop:425 length:180 start_codon:yes stop_codon:yes gene_type:complete